jgi:hypothetical protein
MSQNVTNELIYDLLKQLQADVAEVKATLADHARQFIRMREDINALRRNDVSGESMQARTDCAAPKIDEELNSESGFYYGNIRFD